RRVAGADEDVARVAGLLDLVDLVGGDVAVAALAHEVAGGVELDDEGVEVPGPRRLRATGDDDVTVGGLDDGGRLIVVGSSDRLLPDDASVLVELQYPPVEEHVPGDDRGATAECEASVRGAADVGQVVGDP